MTKHPEKKPFDVGLVAVTLTAGILAAGLLIAQGSFSKTNGELSLSLLDKRVSMLQQTTDPVQRDSMCIPLSAYGRALDRALAPDARVFVSGMLGKTNAGATGYYCFLKNYLFPREVEISLDRKPIFRAADGFEGVPCDSPSELQTNGFDLLVRSGPNGVELVPLTPKGVPK